MTIPSLRTCWRGHPHCALLPQSAHRLKHGTWEAGIAASRDHGAPSRAGPRAPNQRTAFGKHVLIFTVQPRSRPCGNQGFERRSWSRPSEQMTDGGRSPAHQPRPIGSVMAWSGAAQFAQSASGRNRTLAPEHTRSTQPSTMDMKIALVRQELPAQSLDHGCAARDSNPEPAD